MLTSFFNLNATNGFFKTLNYLLRYSKNNQKQHSLSKEVCDLKNKFELVIQQNLQLINSKNNNHILSIKKLYKCLNNIQELVLTDEDFYSQMNLIMNLIMSLLPSNFETFQQSWQEQNSFSINGKIAHFIAILPSCLRQQTC